MSRVVSLNQETAVFFRQKAAMPPTALRKRSGSISLSISESSSSMSGICSGSSSGYKNSSAIRNLPRKVCDLRNVKQSREVTNIPGAPQKKLMAWDGGKIVTNKAEALRRFLLRKQRKGETSGKEHGKTIEQALRKNKDCTVFVKDLESMRPDATAKKAVTSLASFTGRKRKKDKSNDRGINGIDRKRRVKKNTKGKKRRVVSLREGSASSHGGRKKKRADRKKKISGPKKNYAALEGALSSRR